MDIPQLIVVGGPNGSGKSTFALMYARQSGIRYIGADQIAADLSPDDPFASRIEASRQFITRVKTAVENRESIIVESTLAGKSIGKLMRNARDAGFSVTVIFVFLGSADNCVERVAQRVLKGGHDVPEADIRRRFQRCIDNFWGEYRLFADFWVLFYNSGSVPEAIAMGNHDAISVRNDHLFRIFESVVNAND